MAQADFEGKVAVITGGSSGIGLALAHELGRRGAHIAISGRGQEALTKAEAELKSAGIEVLTVQGDVSRLEDCQRLDAETLARFGRADILVNNAGMSMRALFADLDLHVIRQLMEINFFGAVYCTKLFLPQIRQAQGSIVAVSSIAGYRGLPGRTGYSASKAALQLFMEALRTELLHEPVHLMVACPGFTSSNIRRTALNAGGQAQGESPLEEGQIMSAEEVARHIADGIKSRKRDLILTRQGKLTVLMNKLFPGWLDGKVFSHFAKEKGSPISE